jgi:hypothetical protein
VFGPVRARHFRRGCWRSGQHLRHSQIQKFCLDSTLGWNLRCSFAAFLFIERVKIWVSREGMLSTHRCHVQCTRSSSAGALCAQLLCLSRKGDDETAKRGRGITTHQWLARLPGLERARISVAGPSCFFPLFQVGGDAMLRAPKWDERATPPWAALSSWSLRPAAVHTDSVSPFAHWSATRVAAAGARGPLLDLKSVSFCLCRGSWREWGKGPSFFPLGLASLYGVYLVGFLLDLVGPCSSMMFSVELE